MALQNLTRSSIANVTRVCSLLGGAHGPSFGQRRTLTAGEKPKRLEPWNYDLLGYHSWYAYVDNTRDRINDHTKYVVVEGLPACGKNALARKLAQTFDLAYFPDFDEHDIFRMEETVDGQGDYREYNEILPRSMLFYDRALFYQDENPAKLGRPVKLQRDILMERVKRYWSAMAYLFNTGQGVITMRSPLSDSVFAETLHKLNLCRDDSHDFYVDYARKANRETIRPHLVFYCHLPIDAILHRLRNSPLDYERSQRSLLNEAFLKQLDASYREFIDKRYRPYSEVVDVDMSSLLFPKRPRGDSAKSQSNERVTGSIADSLEYDFLIEDVETLDLAEKRSLDNTKRFDDWINIYRNRDTLNMARWKFTNLGLLYRVLSMEPVESLDEFLSQPDHQKILQSIQNRDPRYKNGYAPRWDPAAVGLKQVLLRLDLKNWLRSAMLHTNVLPVEFERFGSFYIPEKTQLKQIVEATDSRWFLPDRRSVDPLALLSGKSAKPKSSVVA